MNRELALKVVKGNLKSNNLVFHSLAVEAVMIGLAEKLGQDEKIWGLAGLLHDVDYEITADDPSKHGLISEEILAEYNLDQEIIHAIKSHNEMTGVPLKSTLDKALYAADPITGLLTACALVKPSKKLMEVEPKSVKKKFKDKAFARGANRAQIDCCVNIGIERGEFIEISLNSMKKIADELGL
jgi:putative nucleotidyltransferase with HDIG domain